MDKIAKLTQELKKMAKDKAFEDALRMKFDLIDRIDDIEDAAREGVATDSRQLIAAKKQLDNVQLQYASEFEDLARKGGTGLGAITGGLLGAMAGSVKGLKGALIGGGLGAMGLGALGRYGIANVSKEETRSARRRKENAFVRHLDRAKNISNLRRAVAAGEQRGKLRVARAGASKTNITNVASNN